MIIVKKFDQFLFLLFISDLKECSTSVNCQLTFQSHPTPHWVQQEDHYISLKYEESALFRSA